MLSLRFLLAPTLPRTGAALSQVIAGSIVHHAGFRAGFLLLAAVALAAFAILYLFMPETRNIRLEYA
jgi:predicted MFS family arabinose efflux permease